MKLRTKEELMSKEDMAIRFAVNTIKEWEGTGVSPDEQYFLATKHLVDAQDSATVVFADDKESLVSMWRHVLTILDSKHKERK